MIAAQKSSAGRQSGGVSNHSKTRNRLIAARERLARVQNAAPAQFLAALTARGLVLDDIALDGRLHRCCVVNKPRSSKPGAYVYLGDGWPAGGIQNFTDGRGWENWQAHDADGFGPNREEAEVNARQWREAAEQRRRQREADCKVAVEKARRLLGQAKPAGSSNPYLARKCVMSCKGLLEIGDKLVVPMRDVLAGELRGLQTIAPDGGKLFLKNCIVSGAAFRIPGGDDVLAVAESIGTGLSVAQATGWSVWCAFGANNLVNVAKGIRARYPRAEILITADNDHATPGNPGLHYGRKAATAASAQLVAPPSGPAMTDFNDYHVAYGIERLRDTLLGVKKLVKVAV